MSAKVHLEWEIPDAVIDAEFERELVRTVKEETALRLFSEGKISSGLAASLLGIPRLQFLDLLERRGIPFLKFTDDDVRHDLEAADRLITDLADRSSGKA